jgi:RNA polymerase sigma factor (TIGR02999 family)
VTDNQDKDASPITSSEQRHGEVTRLLLAIDGEDESVFEELLPLVYEELRMLAGQLMARETPGQTLQATALVHEAYLRLLGNTKTGWKGRAHFFGAAARSMRRILIDNARRKHRIKHGGDLKRVDLDEAALVEEASAIDLLALDEALQEFARVDEQKAKLVELRYFAGLTIDEAADLLQISISTANRSWVFARAWLYRQVQGEEAAEF